jgi:hypothetical protein
MRLLRLALLNAGNGWLRSVPHVAMLAVVTLSGLVSTAGSLQQHTVSEARRIQEGALVIVARAEGGVDGVACERLARSSFVVRAGSLDSLGNVEVRPGVMAPVGSVSPGMIALLDNSDRLAAPVNEVFGRELGERLLLEDQAGTLSVIADRGARTSNVSGWLLELSTPIGAVDECWIEVEADSFELAHQAFAAQLVLRSPSVAVSDLVFDSGPASFDAGTVDIALATTFLVGAFFGVAMARQRRQDLSLYRMVGLDPPSAQLVIAAEIGLWAAVSMSFGVFTWLIAFREPGLSRPVLALALATVLAATLGVAISSFLALVTMSRRRAVVSAIREGG